ncbi:hypothetical protein D3C87_1840850 [compost metagenome]
MPSLLIAFLKSSPLSTTEAEVTASGAAVALVAFPLFAGGLVPAVLLLSAELPHPASRARTNMAVKAASFFM